MVQKTMARTLGMRARSALAVQSSVVFAIAIREMYRKFGAYKLGVVWALLEPIMMISIFMVMFGARGRGAFGFIDPALFILSSFVPFKVLFSQTLRDCNIARNAMASVTMFRQVSLFDVMLARVVMTSVSSLLSLIIIGLALQWMGFDAMPDKLLETLFGLLLIMLFGFGLGIIFCIIGSFAKEMDKVTGLINMPLLFLSSVFFPMTSVPPQYQRLLAYNPLVHPMEYIRESWFAHYTSPVVDLEYYGTWLVVLWAVAMSAYRLRWRRIAAE
jgi:capsular polysaccharide transport system permease protein